MYVFPQSRVIRYLFQLKLIKHWKKTHNTKEVIQWFFVIEEKFLLWISPIQYQIVLLINKRLFFI